MTCNHLTLASLAMGFESGSWQHVEFTHDLPCHTLDLENDLKSKF